MSRTVLFAGCLSLVMPVAGCGGTARSGSRSDTLIVLDRSIGGVSLKEQRTVAEHSVGRGIVLRATTDRSARPRPVHITQVSYRNGSLIVIYASFAKQSPRVEFLETRSSRYRTRSGLGVGSSFARMLSVGGVKCYGTDCQHGYTTVNKPGTTFRLDRPRGKVFYIAITFGH